MEEKEDKIPSELDQDHKKLYASVIEHREDEILDKEGKYYQRGGTFKSIRDANSIGFCILSTRKKHIIMSLEDKTTTPENALKVANNNGWRLPKLWELDLAFVKYPHKLNLRDGNYAFMHMYTNPSGMTITDEIYAGILYHHVYWSVYVSRLDIGSCILRTIKEIKL